VGCLLSPALLIRNGGEGEKHAQTISTGQGGIESRKAWPYFLVRTRFVEDDDDPRIGLGPIRRPTP